MSMSATRTDSVEPGCRDRKSTRLNSSHSQISYAVFCLKNKKHVWVTFLAYPNVHVYCYDVEGNLVWDKSPGQFRSMHGWSAAPILYGDKVIVNCDQDAAAYLVALDRITGEEKWRIDRPNRTRSYCNPIIVTTFFF